MLVFHIVFGKTVPDISLNAVANLGYAECRFLKTVYPGDTLYAVTEVIGLKENSNGKTGTVYVRSTGFNQNDEKVLEFVRWVMVKKRDETSPAPAPVSAFACSYGSAGRSGCSLPHDQRDAAGTTISLGRAIVLMTMPIGEKIDHIDGMTVEEAEHQLATRLYQNTAKVHFNQHTEQQGRFGRRLIYGGHVISLARALSFNGLANAFHISAINAGRHVAPLFAGGTVYAWSEIKDKAVLPGRSDVGALRIVTRATRDIASSSFQLEDGASDKPGVILELDYWALMPR